MSLSRAQAGMVLDPASAWEPVRMNKKKNPTTIIPEHYIRRAILEKIRWEYISLGNYIGGMLKQSFSLAAITKMELTVKSSN